LKAVVHVNNAAHQTQHAAWVRAGLRRHGVDVRFSPWNTVASGPSDLVVIWGWKQRAVIAAAQNRGTPILVMERAHLPPRMEWTSCGLNGLGGRGTYAMVEDGGARWRENFGHLEQPWSDRDGYTLICGQCPGDASIWGVDFRKWAQDACDTARSIGRDVVYRPHPYAYKNQGDRWFPTGARFSVKPLATDLGGASHVVTYNSTAGVETVLAGVPTVATDPGAMAYPMCTHLVDAKPLRPDRTEWMHGLAWTGFRPSEIEDGTMWEHLKGAMPCAMAA
jgi:hypothetical protein